MQPGIARQALRSSAGEREAGDAAGRRDGFDVVLLLQRLEAVPQPSIAASRIAMCTDVQVVDQTGGEELARGNVELRLRKPALYIRAEGSRTDPDPKPSRGPTLRGPRVWVLMRTLIEVTPPYTAGDLSSALGIDDGYVSRVLQTLADERLILRRPRGPVTMVEWEPLLRKLAETYSFFAANETTTWVASAGPEQLLDDIAAAKAGRWAVTGSFVASSLAPVAAPAIACVYADDPERFAKVGRLLPSRIGANVILAKPYDPIVFQRGWRDAGFPSVSVAQSAIDLLSGTARMPAGRPAEGEALIKWIRRDPSRSFRSSGGQMPPTWSAQRPGCCCSASST